MEREREREREQKKKKKQGVVVCAYHPSYMGSIDRKTSV
jgi:hypothetical protein